MNKSKDATTKKLKISLKFASYSQFTLLDCFLKWVDGPLKYDDPELIQYIRDNVRHFLFVVVKVTK